MWFESEEIMTWVKLIKSGNEKLWFESWCDMRDSSQAIDLNHGYFLKFWFAMIRVKGDHDSSHGVFKFE